MRPTSCWMSPVSFNGGASLAVSAFLMFSEIIFCCFLGQKLAGGVYSLSTRQYQLGDASCRATAGLDWDFKPRSLYTGGTTAIL